MLVELVANAVRDALGTTPNGIQVVRQPATSDWDFATPAALAAGRERAEQVADRLQRRDEFEATGVTGDGYVNVRIHPAVFADLLCGLRQGGGPAVPGPAASAEAAQYAHALLAMIQRNAAALGIDRELSLDVLEQRPERTLLTALGEYPAVLNRGSEALVALLTEIAELVPMFIEDRLAVPRGDGVPDHTHRTRLALVDASRIVLANGLAALGLPAPDRI